MRVLRIVHRWLGILLALPLLLQGPSGAILTLEPVWPGWGSHAERSRSAPAAPPASANAVLAAAMAIAPAGMRPSRYMPPDQPGTAVRVQFAPIGQPRGPGMIVSVDPVTAIPLGPATQAAGPIEWVKQLHTSLFVPEWGGRQIAGWFGVGLLALSILGLPLWWPSQAQRAAGQWREAFTVPPRARGIRLHRRLHGAMGIWLWVMLVVTSGTGILQGFPQTARSILGNATDGPQRSESGRPARDSRGRTTAPLAGTYVETPDLDAAIQLALQSAPGTQLRMVMLPPTASGPLRLVVGPPGTEGVTSATTVMVDPAGSKLLSVQSPSQSSPGETVLRWAHDLHFGQGFGPIWRGLTVLVGVALPAFGLTGVSLWLLKRRNRHRSRRVQAAAINASPQVDDPAFGDPSFGDPSFGDPSCGD